MTDRDDRIERAKKGGARIFYYCPQCGDAPFNFKKRSRLAELVICGVCGAPHSVEDYQHTTPYKPAPEEKP